MAESEESLRDKIVKWKSGLEAKRLKMNTGKMKVMFSCSMKDRVEEWPCPADPGSPGKMAIKTVCVCVCV